MKEIKRLEFDYDAFPLSAGELFAAAGVAPLKPCVNESRPYLRPEHEGGLIISPRMVIYDAAPLGSTICAMLDKEMYDEISLFRIIVKNRPEEIRGFRLPWKKRKK